MFFFPFLSLLITLFANISYSSTKNYEPLGHVVNTPTILTKHEAKKYSYKQNE